MWIILGLTLHLYSIYASPILIGNGEEYDSEFNQVADGNKIKRAYALFNPTNDNPNNMGSRGLWGRGFGNGGYGTSFATMKKRGWRENSRWWDQFLRMQKMKRGYGAGFGDFNSGERGFGGATFDHGFGNSFATMKKRGEDQYIQMQKMKRGYGAGFGFGDYDSGKRGFGGATFDHGFGNSFATMKKRGLGFVWRNGKLY